MVAKRQAEMRNFSLMFRRYSENAVHLLDSQKITFQKLDSIAANLEKLTHEPAEEKAELVGWQNPEHIEEIVMVGLDHCRPYSSNYRTWEKCLSG